MNVLVSIDLHKVFKQAAAKKGMTIKEAAEEAISDWVRKNTPELEDQLPEPEKKTAEVAA